MKRLLIIIFALGMFAFAKLSCTVKPEWRMHHNGGIEARDSSPMTH